MRLNLVIASLVGTIAVLGYSRWSIQQDYNSLVYTVSVFSNSMESSRAVHLEMIKRLRECQERAP